MEDEIMELLGVFCVFISVNLPPGLGFMLLLGEIGPEEVVHCAGNIRDEDAPAALERMAKAIREKQEEEKRAGRGC